MTKDDALLGCTYDERMRAIGAVKEALSVADTPQGPTKERKPVGCYLGRNDDHLFARESPSFREGSSQLKIPRCAKAADTTGAAATAARR